MISSPVSSSLAGHPILLAGLLLFAANASAQAPASGTIEGRVSNPRTGEYLENARLSIAGTTLETFTDLDGSYRLINVPAGSARVSVFFTGLAPQTAVVNVPPGGITTRDFTLAQPEPARGATREAEVVKLDEFVVAVSREMEASALAINEQRFAPNIRTVASTDEFGSVAESNVGEFLKFMPGISIDYNAGNPREVSISGVPNGNVPITIDGFDVASTGGGATGRAVALDFLAINNASRIEVVYSPTPESQGSALAGSVNMVPRSSFNRSRPVFNASVYLTMRDNARDFHKTPWPRNVPTRKVRPSADFSWIVPLNKRLGFTLSAGSSEAYAAQESMQNTWRGVNANTNGTTFPHTTVDRPYLSQYFVRVSATIVERRSYGLTLDDKLSPADRLRQSFRRGAVATRRQGGRGRRRSASPQPAAAHPAPHPRTRGLAGDCRQRRHHPAAPRRSGHGRPLFTPWPADDPVPGGAAVARKSPTAAGGRNQPPAGKPKVGRQVPLPAGGHRDVPAHPVRIR